MRTDTVVAALARWRCGCCLVLRSEARPELRRLAPPAHDRRWPRWSPARNDCQGVVRHHGIASWWTSNPITGDPVRGFLEVFRSTPCEVQRSAASRYMACLLRLEGNGSWAQPVVSRGVECRTEAQRRAADDLPYVDLFYRFLRGWAIAFLLRKRSLAARSRLEVIAGVFGLERRRRPLTKPTTQELKWLHQSLFAKH
jgi:hypothetical protein